MISKLQYITQDLDDIGHQQLTINACQAGVDWIQLRVKSKPHQEWIDIAREVKKICHQFKVKLIINDNVNIAKIIMADGVHLGKSDTDPIEARKELGQNTIIGGTANTFEDIVTLASKGIDYIGLGPFRFTSTKSNLSPLLGFDGYKMIMEQCKAANIKIPIVAIGGIRVEDVKQLVDGGLHGIAVSSAITFSKNITETIDIFKNYLNLKQLENIEANGKSSV